MDKSIITSIQSCIDNKLDQNFIGEKKIAGIIGDAPSHYAKSPSIWNPTFNRLQINAVYLPFDVSQPRLKDLVSILKNSERIMGFNVTVPYKIQILDLLDDLDDKAAKIKAVNTVERTEDGSLVGYNTDGSGFLESILSPRYATYDKSGKDGAFIDSLEGTDVLMIGAGGSARAVAFYLAEALGKGRLVICNRTPETAESLAKEVSQAFGNAEYIKEGEIAEWAVKVGLIVNCSTRGQGGIRKMADGRVTILEPYSAMSPANPATFAETDTANPTLNRALYRAFYRDWLGSSLVDIEANQGASLRLALSIPQDVAFCDLIYFPLETVFLRHGRLSGHRTLNGKGMNVAQAADGFYNKVCRQYLKEAGMFNPETYQQVIETMSAAW